MLGVRCLVRSYNGLTALVVSVCMSAVTVTHGDMQNSYSAFTTLA